MKLILTITNRKEKNVSLVHLKIFDKRSIKIMLKLYFV